ncbi:MAG: B12-binding domain-containing radical SAM protein [Promethearchaeota archaeon]
MKLKILYIYPNETWGKSPKPILTYFCRISNFLNSKNLLSKIEEKYLDLRFERISEINPTDINNYRPALKKQIEKTYNEFNFDIIAISCYSSYCYLSTLEIASIIKQEINKSILIIVGGAHVSSCPEDFQTPNMPIEIKESLQKKSINIIDYLVLGEGEIPFYKFVNEILRSSKDSLLNKTKSEYNVLQSEYIENLNDLPIINLDLISNYKKDFNREQRLVYWLDLSRGCYFKCSYCPNSLGNKVMPSLIRFKSIERSIKEIKILNDMEWNKNNFLYISDELFIPKKSLKLKFLNELEKNRKILTNNFTVFWVAERIDMFPLKMAEYYKKANVTPYFGFESGSKKMLLRMGKLLGNSIKQQDDNINYYLKKSMHIIKVMSKLRMMPYFNILFGVPGEDKMTLRENFDFFLKKRVNGSSLIEKYQIYLKFNKYVAYPNSESYLNGENNYGATIYYPNWWKRYDDDQYFKAIYVDPSKNLKIKELYRKIYNFFLKVFEAQFSKKNPDYYNIKNKEDSLRDFNKTEFIQGYNYFMKK